MNFLVLDIEAIRDPAVWSAPEPEPSTVYVEERRSPVPGVLIPEPKALSGVVMPPAREAFAPPFAWRPIVIGCVLFEETSNGYRLRRVGTIDVPKVGAADAWEKALLGRFTEVMTSLEVPELVTWNGRAFDVPVLMLRSLRYGIPQPWYYHSRGCRYRFSEEGHCDLADAMADYGATRDRLGLDGMAKLIGLPGKTGDIDGPRVGEAFTAGRHAEIAAYCAADAVQTAFLFLRWQVLKGDLSTDIYRMVAAELLRHCDADERMRGWAAQINREMLLLGAAMPPEAAAPPAPEAA